MKSMIENDSDYGEEYDEEQDATPGLSKTLKSPSVKSQKRAQQSNQNLSARKSASEDPKNETKFITSRDLAKNENMQGLQLEGQPVLSDQQQID